jgi:conjugative transfer region protein TrbK
MRRFHLHDALPVIVLMGAFVCTYSVLNQRGTAPVVTAAIPGDLLAELRRCNELRPTDDDQLRQAVWEQERWRFFAGLAQPVAAANTIKSEGAP